MQINKEKLPKGQSYPVKSGAIADALERAGITLDCSVNYHNRSKTGFTAYFWPSRPNAPFERLYLTVCAVPGRHVAERHRRMNESVIPAFIGWIGNLLALPSDSPIRREEQVFHVDL